MSIYKHGLAAVLALGLVACGGGGGNAGTSGGGTGGGATQPAYQMTLQLQNAAGADIASNSIAASDSVKLLATLKTAAGAPAAYEVVSFAEAGSGLLQFIPASATALTNVSGQAMVEAKAKDLVSLGATTVTASASVAGTAYTASRNLSVTGAIVEGVDPQTLATGVGFVSVVPADKSIVLAGSGGNGRSETAVLEFQVNGIKGPVPGVRVTFQAIPPEAVTLNSTSGTTDANGIVFASVSAKAVTTAVVVKATVVGTGLTTQSDGLTVTTGTAVPRGFDLSANKYVLNYDISGDASTIRLAVVDAVGNPVSDGFPVVTTTAYGRVGTSGRGGCTTINGICTVEYQVQEPRPDDGVAIPVVFAGKSVVDGVDVEISKTIYLNATSVSWVSLYPASGNTPVTVFPSLVFDTACKAVWQGRLGTTQGFAAPEGTSVEALSFSSQASVSVTSGTPVERILNSRTPVALTFSLNKATAAGVANLQFTVKAGGFTQRFAATLPYPACTPAT